MKSNAVSGRGDSGVVIQAALRRIDELADEARTATAESLADRLEIVELEQMVVAARLIALAAHERRESRGAHFRDDFTEQDDASWLANICLQRDGGGVDLEVVQLPRDRLAYADAVSLVLISPHGSQEQANLRPAEIERYAHSEAQKREHRVVERPSVSLYRERRNGHAYALRAAGDRSQIERERLPNELPLVKRGDDNGKERLQFELGNGCSQLGADSIYLSLFQVRAGREVHATAGEVLADREVSGLR